MKTKLIIITLLLYSFKNDILTTLNVNNKEVNSYLFNAVKSNSPEFKADLVNTARRLPVSVQVECAKQLVQLAKAYTESKEFANTTESTVMNSYMEKVKGSIFPGHQS